MGSHTAVPQGRHRKPGGKGLAAAAAAAGVLLLAGTYTFASTTLTGRTTPSHAQPVCPRSRCARAVPRPTPTTRRPTAGVPTPEKTPSPRPPTMTPTFIVHHVPAPRPPITVVYESTADLGQEGHEARMVITNNSDADLGGWVLRFTYHDAQITSVLGGELTVVQGGTVVDAGTGLRAGATETVYFGVTGTLRPPDACTFDGSRCAA